MTSYPVPIKIHCNQSYMYLMNFKLKGKWKEETLALNHVQKENGKGENLLGRWPSPSLKPIARSRVKRTDY